MKPFRFCPACGAGLAQPEGDGGVRCEHCDRSWYRNSAPTAGCAIVRDGRALVTVRAREPEKGRVDIPGGFLEAGEGVIEGLKREVREELGIEIDVEVDDCISMVPHRYGAEGDWVLALGFRARSATGEPTPNDDVAEIKWVSREELDALDFAWPHDRALVVKALAHEDGSS